MINIGITNGTWEIIYILNSHIFFKKILWWLGILNLGFVLSFKENAYN